MAENISPDKTELNEFFRDVRKTLGITQSDVASATKSQNSQKTVSQFENGEGVGAETAQQLKNALLKLIADRTGGDQEDGLGEAVAVSPDRVISIDGEIGKGRAELYKLDDKSSEELARYFATSPIDIRCSIEKGHDWKGKLQWNLLARNNGTEDIATAVLAIIKNPDKPMKVSFKESSQPNFRKKIEEDRQKMIEIEGSER